MSSGQTDLLSGQGHSQLGSKADTSELSKSSPILESEEFGRWNDLSSTIFTGSPVRTPVPSVPPSPSPRRSRMSIGAGRPSPNTIAPDAPPSAAAGAATAARGGGGGRTSVLGRLSFMAGAAANVNPLMRAQVSGGSGQSRSFLSIAGLFSSNSVADSKSGQSSTKSPPRNLAAQMQHLEGLEGLFLDDATLRELRDVIDESYHPEEAEALRKLLDEHVAAGQLLRTAIQVEPALVHLAPRHLLAGH